MSAIGDGPMDISDERLEMQMAPPKAPPAAAGGGGAMAKKRMSVDPKDLAVPVLQGKLRIALGQKAKLPRKREDLLALYMVHCDA